MNGYRGRVKLAHLVAEHGKYHDGLVVFIIQELAQERHGGIILAPCHALGHVENDGLGDVVRNGIDILDGDLIAFSVGRNLIYLWD